MNFKKIIREEIDDFGWIRDTQPISISNKNWVIHNDVSLNSDEERSLQKWVYSQGYTWPDDYTIEEMVGDDTLYYFNVDDVYFDGYMAWNDTLVNMIKNEDYELFDWSVIKSQLG